jgi:hypothetical protein
MSRRLQWFSQLDGIHQQKDANFQLVKPFFANLQSIISKKYLYMYSMTPKFFISFLTYEYSKNAEFYADFKSMEIIWKKCT